MSAPKPTMWQQRFSRLLRERTRNWRISLAGDLCLNLFTAFLGCLAVYIVLDRFLALPDGARLLVSGFLPALFAVVFVLRYRRCRRSPEDLFARYADGFSETKRQEILSAVELLRRPPDPGTGPLHAHLRENVFERGAAALRSYPEAAPFALTAFRRHFVVAGIALVAAIGFALPYSDVVGAVLPRVFAPAGDHPPYSPHRFDVPKGLSVIYGDDLEVSALHSGPDPSEPVALMVRSSAGEHRLPAFHDGRGRYFQTLENVTRPVEISFTTGRARSRWIPVDIRYQPRIGTTRLRVTPPAYTGRPAREFFPGEEGLRGLAGSRVDLWVTANRPLVGGVIRFSAPDAPDPEASAWSRPATVSGEHTVHFQWKLGESGVLDVSVEDPRGSRNASPYRLRQTALEDAPPRVAITEPEPFSLATPYSDISVRGYAEDDIGLARVGLLRSLDEFRDRRLDLPVRPGETRRSVEREISLASLGVVPGEVLELSLAARDLRPGEPNFGYSDIVQIQIISEAEYEELLWSRATIRDFSEKTRRTFDALEDLHEKTVELGEDAGDLDSEQRAARLEALREQAAATRGLFESYAADYPLFEVEKEAAETLREIIGDLSQFESALGAMDASAPDPLDGQLREAAASLLPGRQQAAGMARSGEELAGVESMMRLAAGFSRLLEEQRLVNRRFEAAAPGDDPQVLRDLARREEELREAVDDLGERIREAADDLSGEEELADLRASARHFADRMDELGIAETLARAAREGAAAAGDPARAESAAALAAMERLLSECSGDSFGGMCRGGLNFAPRSPALRETLAQMMGALGRGSGAGGGAGWGGEDGYAVAGMTPLHIPLVGPQRIRFVPGDFGGGSRGGEGRGDGSGGGTDPATVEQAAAPEAADEPAGRERTGAAIEQSPERYRRAIEAYFNDFGAPPPEPR